MTLSASHVAKIFSRVGDDGDSSALVSSWRRSLDLHGLKPDGAAQPGRIDDRGVLERRQRNEDMATAAEDTLDYLIGILNGADYMVFLADPDGIVLETRSKRTGDFWERPRGDWAGTDFSENSEGTNGVGTVLREGRAMTVAADEHFHVRDVPVVCSGAPIYALNGSIAGCIDISSSAARNNPFANSLMLATAVDAARRIELKMLSNAHPQGKLVLASQTGLHPGAVLAVDRSGGVVGATRSARLLLNLKQEQLNGTLSVEQIWQDDKSDVSWTSAERRVIEAALARQRGNASAAARALGMSRSTLYRKMSDYKLKEFAAP